MSDETGQSAVKAISNGDVKKLDTVMKRLPVNTATINRMKRISSLFIDEIGEDVKEADLIAYFFEKSFDAFLKSGEIENRIKSLTE